MLERESEAGGIPRHCGHMGFGWQSHHRIWTGPRFAAQLRAESSDLDIRTGHTVLGCAIAAAILAAVAHPGLKHVIAAHLSESNNSPELARKAFASAIGCDPGWIAVASQDEGFNWKELA